MNLREVGQAQIQAAERREAPRAQRSAKGTPMPPQADVEYANSLGVEYFSLPTECGQALPAPRSKPDKAKSR
jgi:hypothetical protein